MSTQTLTESARLPGAAVLVDLVQIFDVAEPVTTGINVTRELTPATGNVPGLVQLVAPSTAVESLVSNQYTVKVHRNTPFSTGQAVRVVRCQAEPSLEGKTLLVDKISSSGLSMIRKGVATDFNLVNQQGKGALS